MRSSGKKKQSSGILIDDTVNDHMSLCRKFKFNPAVRVANGMRQMLIRRSGNLSSSSSPSTSQVGDESSFSPKLVLSGYEERRIRSFRLQLQKRLEEANERKASLRKIPEQAILSEVRRMVEGMQTLNKKLEETEAAIEDYFKPIDREAQIIMSMQLEGEENKMRKMVKAMQEQALLENAAKEKMAEVSSVDAVDQHKHENESKPTNQT